MCSWVCFFFLQPIALPENSHQGHKKLCFYPFNLSAVHDKTGLFPHILAKFTQLVLLFNSKTMCSVKNQRLEVLLDLLVGSTVTFFDLAENYQD